MSIGPFEAGFVSQRDNKQCDRRIMCTDERMSIAFKSGGGRLKCAGNIG